MNYHEMTNEQKLAWLTSVATEVNIPPLEPLKKGDRVRYTPNISFLVSDPRGRVYLQPYNECLNEDMRGTIIGEDRGFMVVKIDGRDDPLFISPSGLCRIGEEGRWPHWNMPKGASAAMDISYPYEPPKFFWFLVDGVRRQFCEICKGTIKRHMPHKWDGETDVEKVRKLREQYKEDRHHRFMATGEQALTCEMCGRRGPKRAGE